MNITRDALKLLNPSGFAPCDENFLLGICNFNASLPMFMQYYNAEHVLQYN